MVVKVSLVNQDTMMTRRCGRGTYGEKNLMVKSIRKKDVCMGQARRIHGVDCLGKCQCWFSV